MAPLKYLLYSIFLIFIGCGPSSKNLLLGDDSIVDLGSADGGLSGAQLMNELSREQIMSLEGWFWSHSVVIRSQIKRREQRLQSAVSSAAGLSGFLKIHEYDGRIELIDPISKLTLVFAQSANEKWQLTHVNQEPVEFLHVSWHHRDPIMSLLFRPKSKNRLEAIYFSGQPWSHPKAEVKSKRWSEVEPIRIDICGALTREQQFEAQSAMREWQSALAEYRKLEFRILNKGYFPFSDLNQHCLYIDDSHSPLKGLPGINSGRTYTVAQYETRDLIDADAFIFAGELEKLRMFEKLTPPKVFNEKFRWTVLHEVGHMLGFAHAPPNIKSVMAPVEGSRLNEYDYQQIKNLYGMH